jgi:hypothetical protein
LGEIGKMGKKTGNPRGRPKGSKSQFTKEREQKVQETAKVLEDVLPEAFKGDAHAYLMAVYKDPSNPIKDRLAAATAAIGYEKPKLAAVEVQAEVDAMVSVSRIELVAPSIVSDDHAAH